MTRELLFKFLDKALHELSLEEKADVCEKIKNDWMKDYTSKLLEGQKYCENCKKYFKETEFKFVEETERFIDNYEGALEVEANIVYSFCPKCNNKTREYEVSRKVIRWL